MKVKIIDKEKRLAVFQRNKRSGIRLKVEEASSIGYYKCEFCWLRGRGCSINGSLCFSASCELGICSVMFVRV